jgi:ligand-binding SRPBCC domain-containing protein
MGGRFSVSVSTEFPRGAVEAQALWAHMVDMRNVNDELKPWIRMSYPDDKATLVGVEGLHGAVPMNTTLFCSVLYIFGFIPVDWHWLAFDQIDFGSGFDEHSTSVLQRSWKHSRHIVCKDDVVVVEDNVTFSPRLPLVGYLLLPIVRSLFAHRHHRLRLKFGNVLPVGTSSS